MKKFVLWLIKIFKLDITTTIEKEVIKYKYKYLTDGIIEGNVIVEGNLVIEGSLTVTGEVTVYKNNNNTNTK